MSAIQKTTQKPDSKLAILNPETQMGRLFQMWTHNRSPNTQQAYALHTSKFLESVKKPLGEVALEDLQEFDRSLDRDGLSVNSRIVTMAAVKSLLTFSQKAGFITYNVGAAFELPKAKDALAERILEQGDVLLMIRMEKKIRNKLILQLLYNAGVRVSELCGLCWRDCKPNGASGQITVFGKRSKTRAIVLNPSVWRGLLELRGDAAIDQPVFRSQKGGHLTRMQITRIVKAAAQRAGVEVADLVSPHWMRHSHASHSLDAGAPVHLVQATLGHASLATTSKYAHARPNESSGKFLPL